MPDENSISVDEVSQILFEKELQVFRLRRAVQQLSEINNSLRQELASLRERLSSFEKSSAGQDVDEPKA